MKIISHIFISLLTIMIISTSSCQPSQNKEDGSSASGGASSSFFDPGQVRLEAHMQKDEEFKHWSLEKKLEFMKAISTPDSSIMEKLNRQPAKVCETVESQQGVPQGAYYTNQDGVTVYLTGCMYPFNFLWFGSTLKTKGIDGREYNMADGTGRLIVKNMKDDYISHLYEGTLKGGLWNGPSLFFKFDKNNDIERGTRYSGNITDNIMTGEGHMYILDTTPGDRILMSYEGGFSHNMFHGQGVLKDLKSDKNLYEGVFIQGAFTANEKDIAAEQTQHILELIKAHDPTPNQELEKLVVIGRFTPQTLPKDNTGDADVVILAHENVNQLCVESNDGRKFEVHELVDKNIDMNTKFPQARISLTEKDYPIGIKVSLKMYDDEHFLSFIVTKPTKMLISY